MGVQVFSPRHRGKEIGRRTDPSDRHLDKVKAMKAALDLQVAKIEANKRSAGFVEKPVPLLAEADDLPQLNEYLASRKKESEN